MATNSNDKNSVKASWINVEASAPIIVFIVLPIIFLSIICFHKFANDYITVLLLVLTCLVTIVFILLAVFRPANLTLNGSGHLALKKEEAKKRAGGVV